MQRNLPVGAVERIGLELLNELVAARLSELNNSNSAREFAHDLKAIESNPKDRRGMFIASWEDDLDSALEELP